MANDGPLGRHVHTTGGLAKALDRAHAAGYDVVQVFPGNPRGWRHAPLDPGTAAKARAVTTQLAMAPLVIHAPYIINIASNDKALRENSVQALVNSLDRAVEIGADAVVVHAGSTGGDPPEEAIARVASLIEVVLSTRGPSAASSPRLLLENSAGARNALGGSPEALSLLLAALPDEIGACIDTAHLWGSGLDLSTAEGVDNAVAALDLHVGLTRIAVLHVNDSAVGQGSKRDVHARLGEGQIGLSGLTAWMAHPALVGKTTIMETPFEDDPTREVLRCYMARRLREGDVDAARAILDTLAATARSSTSPPDQEGLS